MVSQPEPEFDDFDREHFEAELDLQADTCDGCGGRLSETTGEPHGYDVTDVTCWRCWAIAKNAAGLAQKAEKDPDVFPSAVHWAATPLTRR